MDSDPYCKVMIVVYTAFLSALSGFHLMVLIFCLLSLISLFACVLTVVCITCPVLNPLSITIVDYLLIKLCLDLRPKV